MPRIDRRSGAALLRLGLALLCAGAPARLGAQTRILPLDPNGYFRIFSTAGTIQVRGWDKDSVRWEVLMAAGQELFGGGNGHMAKVGVSGAAGEARILVTVPRGVKLVIDGGESSVQIDSVAGPVEVQTGSGGVQITGSPVRVTVETADGAVTLAGGPFRSTDVRTTGGMIKVAGALGELALNSVAGAIFADGEQLTRGQVGSVTGVIRLRVSVDPTGTLAVESHGGDIALALPPTPGLELFATSFGGTITNGLSPSRPLAIRGGRGQQLETTIGNGGGTVNVTSFKGTVHLERR